MQTLRARDGMEGQPKLGKQPCGDLVEPPAAGESHEVPMEAHVRRADGDPVFAFCRCLRRRDVVVQRAQPDRVDRGQ